MRRTNFPFFSGSSVVGNMTYLPLFRVTRSKIALENPNTDVWTVSILSCILYSLLMSVYIEFRSRFTYYTCKSILQIQISNCFWPFYLQFSTLNFLLTSNQRILKFRLQIHISRAGLKVSLKHLFGSFEKN